MIHVLGKEILTVVSPIEPCSDQIVKDINVAKLVIARLTAGLSSSSRNESYYHEYHKQRDVVTCHLKRKDLLARPYL